MKENKQYKLKMWYPSLAINWRTDDKYEYDAYRQVMINISNVKNGLAMPKEMVVKKQELHPDFWELIKEEKPKPLFITEDGVNIYHPKENVFLVNEFFEKDEGWYNESVGGKVFFHESNADKYIWRNKPVFSYEDFIKWANDINASFEELSQLAKERSKQ